MSKVITVRIDEDTYAKFEQAIGGLNKSDVIRFLIKLYVSTFESIPAITSKTLKNCPDFLKCRYFKGKGKCKYWNGFECTNPKKNKK